MFPRRSKDQKSTPANVSTYNTRGSVRGERANFTRLVLGCIEAKFGRKYSLELGSLSPRSTQCTLMHRSLLSNVSIKIAEILLPAGLLQKIANVARILLNFSLFLLNSNQSCSGFFQNAANFPKPSGGIQGSVPVPLDAAFGH